MGDRAHCVADVIEFSMCHNPPPTYGLPVVSANAGAAQAAIANPLTISFFVAAPEIRGSSQNSVGTLA